MSNQEDKEIIQAFGYVAIYSAYLEESMFNLITLAKSYIPFKNNFPQYRIADSAKQLRKELKKRVPKKLTNQNDEHYYKSIIALLSDVEKIAKKRNEMLHSIITEHPDGRIKQHNSNNNTSKEISHKNVKLLADDLFDLRTDVLTIYLDGRFKRLLESLNENNDSIYLRLKDIIYNIFKKLSNHLNKIRHK